MRATAFLAMAVLLAASAVGAAPTARSTAAAASKPVARVARVAPPARRALTTTSAGGVDGAPGRELAAPGLPFIEVVHGTTDAHGSVRLYDEQGALDRGEARAFMRIAGTTHRAPEDASEDDERLDLRVVQLAIRAAYHFGAAKMTIVSATRVGARGKHASGEALDFKLAGVKAAALAAYLRTLPRAGVGIYTHPRTQYVHLDVREQSYHWIDGSPPGVTWREARLRDPSQGARDASWSPASDLPESP